MKKIFLLLISIFLSDISNAQGKSFDARLLSKFSEIELIQMEKNNSETLKYWNFFAANAFQIIALPSQKSNAHEIRGQVKIIDLNNVNIFDMKLYPLPKDYQYYRIEESNKLLVIFSEEQLKTKYSKQIK